VHVIGGQIWTAQSGIDRALFCNQWRHGGRPGAWKALDFRGISWKISLEIGCGGGAAMPSRLCQTRYQRGARD